MPYTVLCAQSLSLGIVECVCVHTRARVHARMFGHVQLFSTPWTVACQAPLSMEFSKQEYWSRLPFSSSEELPDPGFDLGFPILQGDSLPSEPIRKANG